MDIGTLGGIIVGFILIAFGIISAQGDLGQFIDVASFFITFGGSIAATFVAVPMSKLSKIGKIARVAFFTQPQNPGEVINMLVTFSEKARREGLLALEDDLEEVEEPFLRKGIQLVVDGTDPELVKNVMMTELNQIDERHSENIAIFELVALLAPSFGLIGTLIGLVIMLRNIEDKSSIGAGMSAALITTLYGAILANLIFTPIAKKLEDRNKQELLMKEIMIEGTLSIQSGDNPRIVKDKLISYLPPSMREELAQEEV